MMKQQEKKLSFIQNSKSIKKKITEKNRTVYKKSEWLFLKPKKADIDMVIDTILLLIRYGYVIVTLCYCY